MWFCDNELVFAVCVKEYTIAVIFDKLIDGVCDNGLVVAVVKEELEICTVTTMIKSGYAVVVKLVRLTGDFPTATKDISVGTDLQSMILHLHFMIPSLPEIVYANQIGSNSWELLEQHVGAGFNSSDPIISEFKKDYDDGYYATSLLLRYRRYTKSI